MYNYTIHVDALFVCGINILITGLHRAHVVKTHPVHLTMFAEPVGPSTNLPPTILGIFKLFFTTALVGAIIEQTNLYARQMLGEAGDQWEEVTAEKCGHFLVFFNDGVK